MVLHLKIWIFRQDEDLYPSLKAETWDQLTQSLVLLICISKENIWFTWLSLSGRLHHSSVSGPCCWPSTNSKVRPATHTDYSRFYTSPRRTAEEAKCHHSLNNSDVKAVQDTEKPDNTQVLPEPGTCVSDWRETDGLMSRRTMYRKYLA